MGKLDQLKAGDLSLLPGLQLEVGLPLSEKVLNEYANANLKAPVQRLHLEIHDNNRLVINVMVDIKLPIVGTRTFERRLTLLLASTFDVRAGIPWRLSIIEGMGAEKVLAQWFEGFINKKMPDGISLVDDNVIVVEVKRLMATQGQDQLGRYVGPVSVLTRDRKLFFHAQIAVDK